MALMEVILQQTYFNQQVVNRWNYTTSGTPAAVSLSFALASAMGWILGQGDIVFPDNTLARELQDLQSSGAIFTQIQVRDVYNPVDFYLTPFPTGVIGAKSASNGVSPATCYGLKTNRTRLDIRRGYKRFVGVTEDGVSSGGVLDQTRLDQVQDLGNLMGDTLQYDDEGNIVSFDPVIVSKEKYTTPSGKNAYRYYGTFVEQSQHLMTSILWTPYTQTRTQVSRQYGRGN